jgi:hypothetical protein
MDSSLWVSLITIIYLYFSTSSKSVTCQPIYLAFDQPNNTRRINTNYVYPHCVIFGSLLFPFSWIRISTSALFSRQSLFCDLPSRCQTDGYSLSNIK